ncbi:thiolase family protein [Streptomyces sp. AJS327]|uniref:thiolase family protein n=1 Tax=Streptomyces sp. AJS327 TaxID=2545265 RepID=UPI0015DEB5C3|nr:thiolase family protein [Streptomyces sp. AJS327]MBA0050909.1 thiolase family protein [Streptomyces sp. AJS327]
MADVYLVGGMRSPFVRRGGVLADVHAADLLAAVTTAALDRCGVPATDVDQVITGCVTKVGDQANNVGRTAWLTAGHPAEVPAVTVDAKCGSSQQAVHYGAGLLASGAADVVVCNGVEQMTRNSLGDDARSGDRDPYGAAYRDRFEVTDQGEAAERIADRWGLDRRACDDLAVASQERAAAAIASGRFDDEVRPVGEATVDTGPRPTTPESLAALTARFRADGVLTAGNSSQITDGASAVILASRTAVARLGLAPLARVTHQVLVGVDPVLKLTGPIPATRRVLERAGVAPAGLALAEVNEAFASVLGAWLKEIPVSPDVVNVNGGAIALGHPVGATGTRLLLTAARELRSRGGGRGLVTMCCGGGLGTATLLEAA